MFKRLVFLSLVVAICMTVLGCATRIADFTLISSKNIDLARGADFKRGPSRVQGEDKVSIIIFIPTGTPNIKQAIDKAIESVPGAVALLDGVITEKSFWIPYIYGEASYVVEGTPLIDPKMQIAAAEMPSNYIVSRLSKNGNAVETKYLSKDEFYSLKKKIAVS